MRLLEAPQTWIAVAVVLLVIAIVLLVLARRSRRTAARTVAAAQAPEPATRASYDPEVDGADPVTGPVDLRAVTTSPRPADAVPAPATSAAPATPSGSASPGGPAGTGQARPAPDPSDQAARDRLLAALLADPQAAVRAVSSIDAANGSGPPGDSVASLLRAGMSPSQVASLCHVRESALAEIVARDLGLLTTRNETDDPGTAWPSLASAAGSTTPTTG